nr:Sir2 family NAD-dependent protein deacetylase [Microbulbifer hainanensis]
MAAISEGNRREYTEWLVTQNMAGLHQRGGSQHVLDLHDRADDLLNLKLSARIGETLAAALAQL